MTEDNPTETTSTKIQPHKFGNRTILLGKIEFYGCISFAVYLAIFSNYAS